MDDPPSLRRPWFNFGRRMSVARWLVVLVGILLPYAIRILGIPAHGVSWFTSYLGIDAFLFFGAFNAICWGSILLATLTYRDVRSVWFPALLGFAVPAYYHTTLDLASSSTAAIGLIFIPIYSLPYVLLGWLLGLFFDRCVFANTADSAAETGQFGLRSLLIVFVLVGIACGLFAYEKRRIDVNMREGIRQAILNGEELDPKLARDIPGDEVDTLKALPILTESEIRAVAVAEVARRTSLPSDRFTEETVQFFAGRWRIVVWRLPKSTKDYYVVHLAKSGKVEEFVQARLP